MLLINDFATPIGLIASISIGFVAVEYVKSYTKILCERVFRFENYIHDSYEECRCMLADPETLKSLEPINVDGKSTNDQIEKLKLNHEKIRKDIDEQEDRYKKEFPETCQSKSLSSICFFIFISNVTLLFLGAIEKQVEHFAPIFSLSFCILSALYIFIVWIFGENEKPLRFLDFSSLRISFIFYLAILILTALSYFQLSCLDIIKYNWIAVMCYALLSYLNFIVFVVKVSIRAHKGKKELNKSKKDMISKCKKIEQDTTDLFSLARIKNNLSV